MRDFFDSFFGSDFFGQGAIPPESVGRKVLGLGAEQPLGTTVIMAAFRSRVRQLRPDLTDDQATRLQLRDVAGHALPAGAAATFASGSTAEQLAELLWAKAFLLSRVPRAVTGTSLDALATSSSRHADTAADRARVTAEAQRRQRREHCVTALQSCTELLLSTRNAPLLAALDRITARRSPFEERTADDRRVDVAVALRLVCSGCLEPLADAVYLHPAGGGTSGDGGDGLLASCAACQRACAASPFGAVRVRTQGVCGCGTAVFARLVDGYSTRWTYAQRAQTCSPHCARLAHNARQRDVRRATRADRACATCGALFTPPRTDGRYCTPACRQAAYRRRGAAQLPQLPASP